MKGHAVTEGGEVRRHVGRCSKATSKLRSRGQEGGARLQSFLGLAARLEVPRRSATGLKRPRRGATFRGLASTEGRNFDSVFLEATLKGLQRFRGHGFRWLRGCRRDASPGEEASPRNAKHESHRNSGTQPNQSLLSNSSINRTRQVFCHDNIVQSESGDSLRAP